MRLSRWSPSSTSAHTYEGNHSRTSGQTRLSHEGDQGHQDGLPRGNVGSELPHDPPPLTGTDEHHGDAPAHVAQVGRGGERGKGALTDLGGVHQAVDCWGVVGGWLVGLSQQLPPLSTDLTGA